MGIMTASNANEKQAPISGRPRIDTPCEQQRGSAESQVMTLLFMTQVASFICVFRLEVLFLVSDKFGVYFSC